MLHDPREFRRLRNQVLLVSAIAWVSFLAAAQFASGVDPGGHAASNPHSHHASPASGSLISESASWAVNWFLMLVAMMSPTLIIPLWYIRVRSFARRRPRSLLLFLLGYAGVWMTFGGLVQIAGVGLGIFQSQSFWPAAALAMIALVWQASPVKQRCLNRCHAHGSFAAFGASADVGAFRFGISHGVWCFGSGWALMLVPMFLPWAHFAAMAAIGVLMFCERLEKPSHPSWRFRGLGKASRILYAQTRRHSQGRRIRLGTAR